MLTTPTTGAIIICSNPRFEDSAGNEAANFITMDMAITYNGLANMMTDKVTFARLATNAEKQAAVRARLNYLLSATETGVTLGNAAIQVSGLPV